MSKRAALCVLLVFFLVIFWIILEDFGLFGRKFLAENFVDNNLAKIVAEQEKKLGIRYISLPKILYVNPGRKAISSYVSPGQIRLAADRVYFTVTDWTLVNRFLGFFLGTSSSASLYSTLNHELSHCYVDSLIRNTPNELLKTLNPNESPSLDELMNRLIQEGIADYVEDCMSSDRRKVGELRMAKIDLDYFQNHTNDFYSVALELVKPIIDRYGNAGIDYLVLRSLDGTRLNDLRGFQAAALKELAGCEKPK